MNDRNYIKKHTLKKNHGKIPSIVLPVAYILLLSLMVIITAAAEDNETGRTKRFIEAVTHYREGNYTKAAEGFLDLINNGIENADLYYDLGNAYFKMNKIGRAIQYYEKAAQLAPNDPDLEFNLNHARSFVKDKAEESASPLLHVLLFWKDMMKRTTVETTAVVFSCLSALFLAIRLFLKRFTRKKTPILPFYISLVPALLFAFTSVYYYYEDAVLSEGIIVNETVPVRSGLSTKATALFDLHAGTKVKIEDKKDGYTRIYFSKDKFGWIKNEDVGEI